MIRAAVAWEFAEVSDLKVTVYGAYWPWPPLTAGPLKSCGEGGSPQWRASVAQGTPSVAFQSYLSASTGTYASWRRIIVDRLHQLSTAGSSRGLEWRESPTPPQRGLRHEQLWAVDGTGDAGQHTGRRKERQLLSSGR